MRRRCGIAKQFFRHAVKLKLIEANPFSELSAQMLGNRARQHFVTREDIQAAIDAAPDHQWRLIIALARYAGLRVPSELLALKWADVDLPAGRMTIRASKTEHHESGGIRICPIFPELRPYMEEAWDSAEPGAEYVITRYRECNANLRTQFLRILGRAGVKPWPKLFHNLRASRQTELLDKFPIKAVCEWLGNSAPVAIEHYAQVTAEHFKTATMELSGTLPVAINRGGEAKSEAVAKQIPKQRSAASNGGDSQSTPQESMQVVTRQASLQHPASFDEMPHIGSTASKVGDEGLEQAGNSRGKCDSDTVRSISVATDGGFASSSTDCDPLLAELITLWPALSEVEKRQIASLLRSASVAHEPSRV